MEKTLGKHSDYRIRRAEVEKQMGNLNDSLQRSSSYFDDAESYASIPVALNRMRNESRNTHKGNRTAKYATVKTTPSKRNTYFHSEQAGSYTDDDSTITCSIVSSAFEQPKQRLYYENSTSRYSQFTYDGADGSDSMIEDKENDAHDDNISVSSRRQHFGSPPVHRFRR